EAAATCDEWRVRWRTAFFGAAPSAIDPSDRTATSATSHIRRVRVISVLKSSQSLRLRTVAFSRDQDSALPACLQQICERKAELGGEHHPIHVRPGNVILLDGELLRPAKHEIADVDAVAGHGDAEKLQQPEISCQDVHPGTCRDHEKRNGESG